MGLSERDYMRVGSNQAARSTQEVRSGTRTRNASSCRLSKSEQVGLGIAALAVIALLLFALL